MIKNTPNKANLYGPSPQRVTLVKKTAGLPFVNIYCPGFLCNGWFIFFQDLVTGQPCSIVCSCWILNSEEGCKIKTIFAVYDIKCYVCGLMMENTNREGSLLYGWITVEYM